MIIVSSQWVGLKQTWDRAASDGKNPALPSTCEEGADLSCQRLSERPGRMWILGIINCQQRGREICLQGPDGNTGSVHESGQANAESQTKPFFKFSYKGLENRK